MEKIQLNATNRGVGKGVARKLRVAGKIPTVLYGKKQTPVSLALDGREFERAMKANPDLTALVDLKIEGGQEAVALVRDYQADVFQRRITHIDLQAVDLNEKIEVEVAVHLIGTAIGVKDESGVLEQLRRKIHIRALPNSIPSHIDIDVSELHIGDSIHADQVKLPEGVEFPHATNYTIAAVVAPTKEEAPVAAAATPVEGAAPAEGAAAAPAADKAGDKKKEEKK